MAASLTFFRGNRKAFDTEVVRATEAESKRPSTIATAGAAGQTQPGRYTCQLNLIDEAGGKFAFSRAPLVLVGERSEPRRTIGPPHRGGQFGWPTRTTCDVSGFPLRLRSETPMTGFSRNCCARSSLSFWSCFFREVRVLSTAPTSSFSTRSYTSIN